jgi:hypothetical protein
MKTVIVPHHLACRVCLVGRHQRDSESKSSLDIAVIVPSKYGFVG